MANLQHEIPVRKRITTYGKTKRKILPNHDFNSVTQNPSIKRNSPIEPRSDKQPSQSHLHVEHKSLGSNISISSPKDIYDISSDEDCKHNEKTSFPGSKLAQPTVTPKLVCHEPKEKDLETYNDGCVKSVPHLLTNLDPLVTTSVEPVGSTNIVVSSSKSDVRLRDIKVNESFQRDVEIPKLVKSIGHKVNTKLHISLVESSDSKGSRDNTLWKRKYMETPTKKAQKHAAGPKSCVSKVPKQSNIDVYDIPSSDEEKIPSKSSLKRSAKNLESYTKEYNKYSVAITKKESKKKLKTSPSSDPPVSSKPLILEESRRSLQSSPSCRLEQVDFQLNQKQFSPKSSSIWKDLLSSSAEVVDNLGSHQVTHLNPETISVKHNSTKSITFEVNKIEKPEIRNQHRLRMIDSLIQQTASSVSSDESLSEDSDSDQYFQSGVDSIPQHVMEPRFESVEPEITNSQTMFCDSQSSVSSQGVGPRFTYSRQRSMLVEEDLMKELALELPTPSQKSGSRRNRRGSIPKLQPLLSFHDIEDEEDNSQAIIKSVHELRKSGAIKRFVDECTDLFDRIGSPGGVNSIRRSGLIDLAVKMRDKTFVRQFCANSMEQQLFISLDKEIDIVSGFLIISVLTSVLVEGPLAHFIPLLCRQGITKLIMLLINCESSIETICKDRKSNMSKISQNLVIEHFDYFLQLLGWEELKMSIFSPRTITLKCLEIMANQSREAENFCDIFSEDLIAELFAIMKSFSYDESWKPSKDNRASDFPLVVACLQAYYIAASNVLDESKWLNDHLPLLADVLESSLSSPHDLCDVHFLLLKMTLQVTNNNQQATEVFARSPLLLLLSKTLVSQFHTIHRYLPEDEFYKVLDHLSLLLGILMNFCEWSSSIRECLHNFQCLDEDPLKDMIIIFTERSEKVSQADSEQETLKNVVLGYLAVTLGFLSQHSSIEKRILSQRNKLLNCIEEFILIHKIADRKIVDGDDEIQMTEMGREQIETEAQIELTERLEQLVKKLKNRSQ